MLNDKELKIYTKLCKYSDTKLKQIYLQLTDDHTTTKLSRMMTIELLKLIWHARELQRTFIMFVEYKVNDVSNIDEFYKKYYKANRMPSQTRGGLAMIKEYGCTWISPHDSKTGECVAFYPNNREELGDKL